MAKQTGSDWHPWQKAAIECGQRLGSFFAVAYGSPEWESWCDYFRNIGYMPIMFRKMEDRDQWTAPTRWPSMLDFPLPEFARTDVPYLWRRQRSDARNLTAAELDTLFARHGLSHLRPGSKFHKPRQDAAE